MSTGAMEAAHRLREAFLRADFTVAGVRDRLGPAAWAALHRREVVPAERATRSGDSLDTLIRLLLLGRAESMAAAGTALPLPAALEAELVETDGDHVRACWEVWPYAPDEVADSSWWIAADPSPGPGRSGALRADAVLGVGGASRTLAQLLVPATADRALDLGTGCGVQALHLAQRSSRVVATDILPRALRAARLTARLSGVPDEQLGLREGNLFEPVGEQRFDLVVSNPPFVIHPPADAAPVDARARNAAGPRFHYRDSGLAGDAVCQQLLSELPQHLTEAGWGQLLVNWQHVRGQDWRERVAGWLGDDLDAWVVQRDVLDVAEYVATWLRDAGETNAPDYPQRYDAWLAGFEAAGVEAVGFGYLTVRRHGASYGPAVRVLEEWPHPVEQPLGPAVRDWFDRGDWLRRASDADLLASAFTVAPDVRQEQLGLPGAEDPEHLVLRQQRGMRRAVPADTSMASIVGACTGELPLGVLSEAAAQILHEQGVAMPSDLLPQVRQLVTDGFLLPPKLNG